ncbi:hypothetical protein OF83DRAFT_1044763, partial [Amylostereum chailletii]
TLPLVIAQYERQTTRRKFGTEHWSLAALLTCETGHIFEITGCVGDYCYKPRGPTRLDANKTLRGACLVGSVTLEKLGWVETALSSVDVPRGLPMETFNGQTWVLDALKTLKTAKEAGIGIKELTSATIRLSLENELELWETGDD